MNEVIQRIKTLLVQVLLGMIFTFAFFTVIMLMYPSISSRLKAIPDPKIHYINLNCVVIQGGLNSRTIKTGKTATVIENYHFLLIKSLQDTTLYCEYEGLNHRTMKREKYYSYKIGDTLHFDFIKKDKFFKIKK